MSFHTILGLDLGKFKSVGCVMNVATREQTFETIQTTPAVVHDFLVRHAGANAAGLGLVIETCDAAGWVYDLAVTLGVGCTVIHTIGDERWAQAFVEKVSRGGKGRRKLAIIALATNQVRRTFRPRCSE
jgi:hypothetical protein